MKNLLFILPIIFISCKTAIYNTGDQSFMKFDQVNYEYYQVESLLSNEQDSIVIGKNVILIHIFGQETIIIKITDKYKSKKIIVYDGRFNGEECRLTIIKKEKLIGFYHTYNEDIGFFTELIIFQIN